MPKQPVFLNGPPQPFLAPPPQIVLTLVQGQVQLQSNIQPGPETWRVIAQICLQGAAAALQELARADGAATRDGPRIVVPTLQVKH